MEKANGNYYNALRRDYYEDPFLHSYVYLSMLVELT